MERLTKTQSKQEKIVEWCLANGWRQDPQRRPVFYSENEEGERIRLKFAPRSLVLQKKVALTEEEKKTDPRNMKWIDLRKRSYAGVKIARGKIDWGDAPELNEGKELRNG
jgi:hypothetical protein